MELTGGVITGLGLSASIVRATPKAVPFTSAVETIPALPDRSLMVGVEVDPGLRKTPNGTVVVEVVPAV